MLELGDSRFASKAPVQQVPFRPQHTFGYVSILPLCVLVLQAQQQDPMPQVWMPGLIACPAHVAVWAHHRFKQKICY